MKSGTTLECDLRILFIFNYFFRVNFEDTPVKAQNGYLRYMFFF